ncbi:MAG TPA: hypothetical protein VK837_11375 [Longimicrobiales bacterium]|nr:hypothetical protein [Longimicrobiales bacterium]
MPHPRRSHFRLRAGRRLAVAGCGWMVVACGTAPDEDRFASPATVTLAPDTLDLAGNLARLQGLVAEAREAEGDALFSTIRDAERVTDRLLETAPPVAWMPEQYSVDATLRQFQAAADRIVARLRRGAGAEDIADELAELEASVARLRQVLEEGTGRPAPPSLDSLLADSAATRRSPVEVFGGAPSVAPPTRSAPSQPPVLLGASADSTGP